LAQQVETAYLQRPVFASFLPHLQRMPTLPILTIRHFFPPRDLRAMLRSPFSSADYLLITQDYA
jgi:hypothetical protein